MKVLAHKNIPTKFPIWTTAVGWLLLDRFQPAQWVWGAVGVLALIIWGISIHAVFTQKQVDLFEDKD